MTVGKILLILFGILSLITSISLIVGGGVIIAANETLTDNDGYFNTPVFTIEPEDNVVAVIVNMGNIDFDETEFRKQRRV